MTEDEIKKAYELLIKLDPIVERHITKLADNYGMGLMLLVITNIATSLLATAVVIEEEHGSDIEHYMSSMLSNLKGKYHQSKSQVETLRLMDKMMQTIPGSHQGANPTKH